MHISEANSHAFELFKRKKNIIIGWKSKDTKMLRWGQKNHSSYAHDHLEYPIAVEQGVECERLMILPSTSE